MVLVIINPFLRFLSPYSLVRNIRNWERWKKEDDVSHINGEETLKLFFLSTYTNASEEIRGRGGYMLVGFPCKLWGDAGFCLFFNLEDYEDFVRYLNNNIKYDKKLKLCIIQIVNEKKEVQNIPLPFSKKKGYLSPINTGILKYFMEETFSGKAGGKAKVQDIKHRQEGMNYIRDLTKKYVDEFIQQNIEEEFKKRNIRVIELFGKVPFINASILQKGYFVSLEKYARMVYYNSPIENFLKSILNTIIQGCRYLKGLFSFIESFANPFPTLSIGRRKIQNFINCMVKFLSSEKSSEKEYLRNFFEMRESYVLTMGVFLAAVSLIFSLISSLFGQDAFLKDLYNSLDPEYLDFYNTYGRIILTIGIGAIILIAKVIFIIGICLMALTGINLMLETISVIIYALIGVFYHEK